MFKKISKLALAFLVCGTLSVFAQSKNSKKSKEAETAEIGEHAKPLATLRIFNGQNNVRLFKEKNFTILYFWEFNPKYAKKQKAEKLTAKERKEKKEELLEELAAFHIAVFKARQYLHLNGLSAKTKIIAINNEPTEETEKILKELGEFIKKRDKKNNGEIAVEVKDVKGKEVSAPWLVNYSLGYDAVLPATKEERKDEDAILRGQVWKDYVDRFEVGGAPVAFIIARPEDTNKPPEKTKNKGRKTAKELEEDKYPFKVLWIGNPERALETMLDLSKKEEGKGKKRNKKR